MSDENAPLAESVPQPLPPHPTNRGAFGAQGSGDTSGFGGLVRRVANPANLPAGTPRPYGSYFDGVVDTIEEAVDDVLAANPDAVERYRGGEKKVLGFLVGQVMRATQGKADPKIVNQLLGQKLS